MKLQPLRDRRRLALALAGTALVAALVVLAVDAVRGPTAAARWAARLQDAETAARDDPAAAQTLHEEVARQTASSLARTRRQRGAGVVALIAAGLCVALSKAAKHQPRPLPRDIAQALARRDATAAQAPPHASDDAPPSDASEPPRPVDLAPLDEIVARIGRDQHHLIPLLHAVDHEYRYLPAPALARLAELTEISPAQIAGVASFYTQFRTRPRGAHCVQVCRGAACHVAGADRFLEELRRVLRIPPGADTDADAIATVETVGCLGCCTLAPVINVDGQIIGQTSVQAIPALVAWDGSPAAADRTPATANHTALASAGSNHHVHAAHRNGHVSHPLRPQVEIRIGVGSCCVAGGSRDVLNCLEQELAAQHLDARITPVGCVGICHLTPLVEIAAPGSAPVVAVRATPADVRRIVRSIPTSGSWSQTLRRRIGSAWARSSAAAPSSAALCQVCPADDERIRRFIDPQVRIVTEHSGHIDPTSLADYRDHDGFVAIERTLHDACPDAIIDAIEHSGLRGRGGGGFPTATKWKRVRAADGDKFLVCNGDEGDPGAFMDRMVMESYPFRLLEGMLIAAYAVGASRGIIYVRHEYPLAVERLHHAIDEMTAAGYLGDDIRGSGFSFSVEIVEGAGAFVCGEETALLQSIMGQRGTPQVRPPYPVERGLFERPTLVNNVETLANVPWIIRNGAERYAALGTLTSKGTKVFSLAGKVRGGGLIEIPMGLTIREVVETIGGGVAEGRQFKAVQIGGPSGGCIPARLADTPIDYESLQRVGAIMGSGGLIVLDDSDCMVDVARYFLEFTQKESCGHCTFCRVGTRKLLDILERICAGRGKPHDLDDMESLCRSIALGSLCGLGKTAPNPVLSTLTHFRDEYEAHLAGRCPAGRCKALIRYETTRECVGCTLCAQRCPVGAIEATPYRQHVIDSALCTRCDVCRSCCPEHAIRVV